MSVRERRQRKDEQEGRCNASDQGVKGSIAIRLLFIRGTVAEARADEAWVRKSVCGSGQGGRGTSEWKKMCGNGRRGCGISKQERLWQQKWRKWQQQVTGSVAAALCSADARDATAAAQRRECAASNSTPPPNPHSAPFPNRPIPYPHSAPPPCPHSASFPHA